MSRALIGCFVGLAAMAGVTAADAADLYRMQMSVTRAGVVIGKPDIRFEANRPVDLTVTPPDGMTEHAVRLQVVVSRVSEDPANSVDVRMLIFDRSNGEWVLRSGPELRSKFNTDVSLTVGIDKIKRAASPLGINFQVEKMSGGSSGSVAVATP